jgi:(p)ppGpp synthase/HD superfamily hydrolase
LSDRYTKAVCLAAKAHEGQFRKSTAIPYITHPVAVAGLVAKYGGDEDQQIAGLFHDILEDGGPEWEPQVAVFGPRVLAIVKACTDAVPDESGQKAPWKQRKIAYLDYLREETDDALLVSACDKLHNLEAILLDLTEIGIEVFNRFSAEQSQVLWYYRSLIEVFEEREAAPAEALRKTYTRVVELSENT